MEGLPALLPILSQNKYIYYYILILTNYMLIWLMGDYKVIAKHIILIDMGLLVQKVNLGEVGWHFIKSSLALYVD